jgi:polynucleotide 5'-hydroxyl-kinase GRC3/NOL9
MYEIRVRMVKGPARVVVNGPCHVLGSDVSGKIIEVRAGKALPFELSNRCRLQARLGYGARLWWADPNEAGTSIWHSLAKQVLSALAAGRKITLILMGDTDTGKSTLTIYLANMAIRHGFIPCIIDGDIGQGDLAPPTAIGAAILSKQVVDLRDVSTGGMFEFVGSTSPAGLDGLIARKLKSMLYRTTRLANIIIVNTDGYVRNGGAHYKAMIAKELQPDVIILLGENGMLFDTLKTGPWRILSANPSSQIYKSRLERIGRRLDQFLRYIGNGSYKAQLSQVKFVYMGKLFSRLELLFYTSAKLLEPESFDGMFVGLGSNGNVIGFGIIINMLVDTDTINLQTDINSFDTIYVSNVRVRGDTTMEIRFP